ncbi:2-dehydro-3-deoxygalactonokinase [Sphingomonas radiodurans]|uniref:2-dehydro-3-deoxygalactonokinase n=1 Tax=Sphingomonas radiodurans TaxID=2890321 RepID=UPI001E5DBF67|nr:2-dehydro-3-deoxygalactonokinase [Sphingomonas radiodurans]WBH15512.1 2-dehydro-3-deoxygalactonokinase [Sphingomonas radiodurans]
MTSDPFIAVDWGTTNRRAFVIDRGRVLRIERDAQGAATLTADDYPAAVAELRERLGDLPMLLAGMVGSTIGWRDVPYVAAPAGLDQLAAALHRIDDRTAIVPGLCDRSDGRADVMRGEEVQLLGAVAAELVPRNALLCQPGTHCKWATVENSRITRFTTAMTGELFALLRGGGLLARQLGGDVVDGPAFHDGLAEGAKRDLAASLFGIRVSGVLGLRDDRDAASFASGLLIGADVAARLGETDASEAHILADPGLGALYAAAVSALGGRPAMIDSQPAFVAGITRLRELAA